MRLWQAALALVTVLAPASATRAETVTLSNGTWNTAGVTNIETGGLIFNEIMYRQSVSDPNDQTVEWVEIANTTGAVIDLSGYRLVSGVGGNHSLNVAASGSGPNRIGTRQEYALAGSIAAGGYLVVGFQTSTTAIADGFSASLIQDWLFLGNASEKVVNAGEVLSLVRYTGTDPLTSSISAFGAGSNVNGVVSMGFTSSDFNSSLFDLVDAVSLFSPFPATANGASAQLDNSGWAGSGAWSATGNNVGANWVASNTLPATYVVNSLSTNGLELGSPGERNNTAVPEPGFLGLAALSALGVARSRRNRGA